jgi:photosystem II stability/assembly factor-like uncharacterized protein
VTWQSIEEGLPTNFGMTVVTHPRQGETLWLVPITSDYQHIPPDAHLQVQRSDDAGKTWRTLSGGLPGKTYTNVLRDAACTDSDPDQPGFYVGTRNGEVYASTDGGESFSLLATQLPDVYCVRALTRS